MLIVAKGCGVFFGRDVVGSFNIKNDLDLIVRAHQLVIGYMSMFKDALVPVWSTPYYCIGVGMWRLYWSWMRIWIKVSRFLIRHRMRQGGILSIIHRQILFCSRRKSSIIVTVVLFKIGRDMGRDRENILNG